MARSNRGGMQIEQAEVSSLIPYANNAKHHPDIQIQQIMASIQEFGFNDPIAVDQDNVIIEGHGRLLAAQRLALDTVPVIRLSHMNEAQKKLYILAHNRINMNTGFDMELVQNEMNYILTLEPDANIYLTGFEDYMLQGGDFSYQGDVENVEASDQPGKDYIRVKCFVADKAFVKEQIEEFIKTLEVEGLELS